MTKELWVNDSGTVKQVNELHVNDGGTVKNVTEGWINDNGVVKQFFPSSINTQPMIITVRTIGFSENFTLPFQPTLPVNPWAATINWGDGSPELNITTYNDPSLTHTYDDPGDYNITISGSANCLDMFTGGASNRLKLIDVKQWGTTGWTVCQNAFLLASNCVFSAGSIADTSNVTTMTEMFNGCTAGDPDVSGFDTSLVNSMTSLFRDCVAANPDVSGFDTSNVAFMTNMFRGCSIANPEVQGFNISTLVAAGNFCFGSAFSNDNYDDTLIAWEAQAHNDSVTVHFGGAKYGAGSPTTARANLVSDLWVIADGGAV